MSSVQGVYDMYLPANMEQTANVAICSAMRRGDISKISTMRELLEFMREHFMEIRHLRGSLAGMPWKYQDSKARLGRLDELLYGIMEVIDEHRKKVIDSKTDGSSFSALSLAYYAKMGEFAKLLEQKFGHSGVPTWEEVQKKEEEASQFGREVGLFKVSS